MYRKVLVPLDGSKRSEAIFNSIRPLLQKLEAEVVVQAVYELGQAPWEAPKDVLSDEEKSAWEYVNQVIQHLQGDGLKVTGIVESGHAAEKILDHVGANGIDLVAMATHGRTGLDRVALGSTVERVLRECPVPVLTARTSGGGQFQPDPLASPEFEPLHWQTIGVLLDGSEYGEQVLADARHLAKASDSEIQLVHAIKAVGDYAFGGGLATRQFGMQNIEEYLAEKVTELEADGFKANSVLIQGAPGPAVHAFLETEKVDLLALTTHGRSGIARWLLGSVAESVIRSVGVPVLLKRIQSTD